MPEGNNNTETQTTPDVTFEGWLEQQDEQIRGLYEAHTAKLTNAVKATRQERDDLAKQLKDLLPKAEKGSELEKSLADALGRIEQAERRAAFAEEAVKPEIGCRNPRAAYLLAQADNLFDRRGQPDWAAIKAAAPELFGAPGVKGNAGAGTSDKPPKADMNAYIRHMAGRR